MNTAQTSHPLAEGWGEQLEAVRAELDAIDRQIRSMARTQPLTVVAVALAAGFVLGRIIRR